MLGNARVWIWGLSFNPFFNISHSLFQVSSFKMMHSAIKGGWSPTFALAKKNDSDGRKTRIRLSKDKRKAMIQTFINKYQESNGGNFPPITVTHKEVGGSFYTVREIVREIIQENRVLGPAKFNLEEFSTDQFLEQNPLGSIASGPQPFLRATSNEDHPEHNKVPGKLFSLSDNGHVINVDHVDVINKETIEATVVSDGYYTVGQNPVVVNGHVINGSQVDVTSNEFVEAAVVSDRYFTGPELEIADKEHDEDSSKVDVTNKESVEAVVVSNDHSTGGELKIVDHGHDVDGSKVEATIPENKPTEPKLNVEQELAATTMPSAKVNVLTKDLIVETFPLRSVARTSSGTEGSAALKDSGNSLERDIKKLELEQGKNSESNGIEPTNNSTILDEKFENALGNKDLKEISDPRHDVGSANLSTHSEQITVSHQKAITFETNNKSQIEDEAKTNIQDDSESPPEGLHKADKYRLDQLGGSSQRRVNTTVDRINLESWDGRLKNSAKKEDNPLLALLKAIVNAFGKLLSE
ncbi:unnamed protein product [Vicia faba]|uniref:AT3G52170-like helix-turn-helix domain-containing protein n=1 Tax=Vicia faba TaxID=3906 RepID=A0AAV1A008_VICFA|nr:unnamed protein product [Vicia faba]